MADNPPLCPERPGGYYWVRKGSEWKIGYHRRSNWFLLGSGEAPREEELDDIGEGVRKVSRGWTPIETLPRDRTMIVLLDENGRLGAVNTTTASWVYRNHGFRLDFIEDRCSDPSSTCHAKWWCEVPEPDFPQRMRRKIK